MIFKRKKKKDVGDESVMDALEILTTEHANASIDKDRIADSTYFLNEINIVTQEHADLFEESIGSHVPVIVVVAHGQELVDRLIAVLTVEGSTENKPDVVQ